MSTCCLPYLVFLRWSSSDFVPGPLLSPSSFQVSITILITFAHASTLLNSVNDVTLHLIIHNRKCKVILKMHLLSHMQYTNLVTKYNGLDLQYESRITPLHSHYCLCFRNSGPHHLLLKHKKKYNMKKMKTLDSMCPFSQSHWNLPLYLPPSPFGILYPGFTE